jgi:hypothetical protein
MTFEKIISTAPHTIKRKLEQLKFLRERPDFHPEPSTFHHLQIVTERLLQTGDPDLFMSGVLHDICKFDTVQENPKTGWPTCPGHDIAAFNLIAENHIVKTWIVDHGADPTKVAWICRNHMRFHQLAGMRETKREAQISTWKQLGIWDALQIFGAADNMLEEFDLSNLEKSWKFNRKN